MWSVWLVFCDCGFHLSALWWIRIRGLWKLPGWDCVPSLLFDLRPNYGRGSEDNGDLLQKVLCTHCHIQCPWPYSRQAMTNLDSILKSRDITLPTKVRLVKAMVFPVLMYGCESWTVKEWVSEWVKLLSRARLFATPWTAAYQAPPCMGFSRQEY